MDLPADALTVETDRLLLRPFAADDLAAVADMHTRADLARSSDHDGRGYATEGAREMLRLGFERSGLHRIVGRLDGRNVASARVLEKLGMRREARRLRNELVEGEWTDELVHALLEDEWPAGAAV